jgi:hypothetical protein
MSATTGTTRVKAPDAVQHHPNATFVLSTTPVTTLLVWGLLQAGLVLPQAVAAAVGTLIPGCLLIFRSAITSSADAVWTLGFAGCCRRIWHGSPPGP